MLTPEVAGTAHVVAATGYATGAFGFGMAIGPALGGLLSQPTKHFPGIFRDDGLFARYPYLLPNLVGAGLALICIGLTILFVPETTIRRKGTCMRVPPKRSLKGSKYVATPDTMGHGATAYHPMGQGSDITTMTPSRRKTFDVDGSGHELEPNKGECVTLDGLTSPWYGMKYVSPSHGRLRTPSVHRRSRVSTPNSARTTSPAPVNFNTQEDNKQTESGSRKGSVTWAKHSKLPVTPAPLRSNVARDQGGEQDVGSGDELDCPELEAPGIFGRGGLLQTPTVPALVCATCLLDGAIVGFYELFPLWAISTSAAGGLDWNMVLVGQVFLVSGLAQSVYMFSSYSWCSERVGIATFHRAAGILAVVLSAAMPFIGHLNWNDAGIFIICSVMVTLLNGATYTLYSAMMMASANPIPPRLRGKLVGLLSASQCIGSLLGPVGFSVMFAWSISSTSTAAELPLVDQHFTFFVGAILRLVLLPLVWNVLTAENMMEVVEDLHTPEYEMSPANFEKASEAYAPMSPGTPEGGRQSNLI